MNKNVEESRNQSNVVELMGEVAGLPVFSHEVFGEGFYIFEMLVPRLSDATDLLPVMVSDRMCSIESIQPGNMYAITGQFRSYNKHEENKNRLMLSVFALEMNPVEEEEFEAVNTIKLEGYVCKGTEHRITPLGREIADLLVAVNRPYGKSDYIPCIAWSRSARFVSELEVGTPIKLSGRIQSREYRKTLGNGETETRVAYEVSISRIERM